MQSHRKNVSNPLCYRELLFRCCCFVTSDTFKPFTTGALHSLCRCVSAAREPRTQIDSGLCEPHVTHLTNLRAASFSLSAFPHSSHVSQPQVTQTPKRYQIRFHVSTDCALAKHSFCKCPSSGHRRHPPCGINAALSGLG